MNKITIQSLIIGHSKDSLFSKMHHCSETYNCRVKVSLDCRNEYELSILLLASEVLSVLY